MCAQGVTPCVAELRSTLVESRVRQTGGSNVQRTPARIHHVNLMHSSSVFTAAGILPPPQRVTRPPAAGAGRSSCDKKPKPMNTFVSAKYEPFLRALFAMTGSLKSYLDRSTSLMKGRCSFRPWVATASFFLFQDLDFIYFQTR